MDSAEHHYQPQPETPRQSQHEPQRLSGIYQYHNAPEVLPEHGLEYDDTVYPVSDKYPVTGMEDYPSGYSVKYRNESKPPRIIFGMKVRNFMLVTLLFILIVVGAVVGGTVGRSQAQSNADEVANDYSTPSSTPTSPGVRTIAAASSSIPTPTSSSITLSTPTSSPLSACPAANNTLYTSSLFNSSTPSIGLNFTLYCDLASPLSSPSATILTTAFVYTFDDCVEVCASYNFYEDGNNCTVAVYDAAGKRPSNCIVGAANVTAATLGVEDGGAVALLHG